MLLLSNLLSSAFVSAFERRALIDRARFRSAPRWAPSCLSANRDATVSQRANRTVCPRTRTRCAGHPPVVVLTRPRRFARGSRRIRKTARRGGLVHPRGAMPARRVVQSSAGNKHASRCRAATLGGPTALAPADAPRRAARPRVRGRRGGRGRGGLGGPRRTERPVSSVRTRLDPDSAFAGGCRNRRRRRDRATSKPSSSRLLRRSAARDARFSSRSSRSSRSTCATPGGACGTPSASRALWPRRRFGAQRLEERIALDANGAASRRSSGGARCTPACASV